MRLRLCLPSEMLDDLDLGTLRLLPAEHVDAELRRRRGDLLWTARLRGGGAAVFPVEAQSTHDERMAARMTTLTGMLYEGIATTLKGPDGGPVAVLPIVLYTGRRRWSAGRGLAELADLSSGFAPYVAGPRYLLLDVGALAAHDLPQRNRMAVLVRLETARSPEELLEALRGALVWLGDDELGPVFVNWVSEVLMPLRFPEADRTPFDDLQEGVTMLAERAKEWTEQWFAEGREDGPAGRPGAGLGARLAGHGGAACPAQVRRCGGRAAVARPRPHRGPCGAGRSGRLGDPVPRRGGSWSLARRPLRTPATAGKAPDV